MLPKKSKKADLERKRFLFFQIGLTVSIALVILAFEWPSKSNESLPEINTDAILFEIEQAPVTRRKQPPRVHRLELREIKIIPTEDPEPIEDYIPIDAEADEFYELPDYLFNPEEPEEEDDYPRLWAPVMPDFNGEGVKGFQKYVARNVVFPEEAIKMGLSGRVIVQFTVDRNGNVTDVVLYKGAYPCLDDEAIRVIKSSPKWTPGEENGRKVPVRYIIPVYFKME